MCVQNLDDSRGLAIRITYRISLRSSSLWEPRHPLLKVVQTSIFIRSYGTSYSTGSIAALPNLINNTTSDTHASWLPLASVTSGQVSLVCFVKGGPALPTALLRTAAAAAPT
jgi:hypothetical protein